MAWNHIANGTVSDSTLELFQDGADYMIRVNGLELMNSRCHQSEKALADLAPQSVKNILIGGLGLGFTLAAFLERFESPITVIEKSKDVLEWYTRYFRAGLNCDDSQVTFANCGIEDHMSLSDDRYDLIVLDVDNGPEALSAPENSRLYTTAGLIQVRRSLSESGTLLLWSSFESSTFIERAEQSGFSVRCVPVPIAAGRMEHFIFECKVRH